MKRSGWHDVACSHSTSCVTRLSDVFRILKGLYMNKLVDKLVASLVAVVLPRVVGEMVKAVEELVHSDLNNDGVIGFGKE